MRALRPLILATGVLLALLVAAAWLVPPRLDWSRTRGTIAGFASQVLGRQVHIDGQVSLDLLPTPTLTASGFSLDGGSDGLSISGADLRLRVALTALLAGHIRPRDLVLQHPLIRVPFPFSPDVLARRPPWLRGLAARIEDGRLELGGLEITAIEGSFAPDPLTGTLAAAAHGVVLGGAWQATARLGQLGGDGTAPLQLALDGEAGLAGTGGNFVGRIEADGGIAGRVSGRGPDLSRLLPAPRVAWQGEGWLTLQGGLAAADSLQVQIGGMPAHGALSFRLSPAPRLDLSLAAGRIDLDAWAGLFQNGPPPPLLPGLAASLDLSADAGVLPGLTLRDLRLALDLLPGHTELRAASAVLPGQATVALHGVLTKGPVFQGPVFQGRVQIVAPDLRTTVPALRTSWPALGDPVLAGLLPRQATLAAGLRLEPARLVLDDATGTLDGGAMSGALAVRLAARPAITLRLVADRLVLDPLLAGAPGDPRGWGADVDLRVQARRVELAGQVLDRLVVDGSSNAGGVTLRSLQAGWQGLQGVASGALGRDGTLTDGKLFLAGPAALPLRALLPSGLRGPMGLWRGRLDAALALAGKPSALAGTLQATLGNATLDAKPDVDLPGRRVSGMVSLQHPSAARLLARAGLPGLAPFLGEGSLSVIAQAAVSPDRLTLDQLNLGAGLLRLGGKVVVAFGAVPAVTGQVAAETLPLLLPDPHDTAPLDMSGLLGWRADLGVTAGQVVDDGSVLLGPASFRLGLAEGRLALSSLHAALDGGAIEGGLSLDSATQPARLAGQVKLAGLDLMGGKLSGDVSATAAGFSPAALAATLGGTASLSLQGGTLQGVDAAALRAALAAPDMQSKVQAALSGGSTMLTQVNATLGAEAGQVLVHGALQAEGAAGTLSGALDLSDETLDVTLALRPDVPLAPDLAVRWSGPFAAPVRGVDLSGLATWLARLPSPPGPVQVP